MNSQIQTYVPLALALVCLSSGSATQAYDGYSGHVSNSHHYRRQPVTLHQYFSDHPKVKAATVGAGVGTATGAITGLVTGRGVLQGAAVGAGLAPQPD